MPSAIGIVSTATSSTACRRTCEFQCLPLRNVPIGAGFFAAPHQTLGLVAPGEPLTVYLVATAKY